MKDAHSEKQDRIDQPSGKLGVLIPGIGGALGTTLVAGVELVRRGLAFPTGSLTQLGTLRTGTPAGQRPPLIKEYVPLADLNDLVFGGWDIYEADGYEAALFARVLDRRHLDSIKGFMKGIRSMPGVFDRRFVHNVDGNYVNEAVGPRAEVDALKEDIRRFREENGVERCVMIWCASTELSTEPVEIHRSAEAFQQAVDSGASGLAPSMLYALAAVESGIPFINASPSLTADIPSMAELAERYRVPIAGKDIKTGRTLMQTLIAPGLRMRALGIEGWHSTNIVGNRNGCVLNDRDSFGGREENEINSLIRLLEPQLYPSLYKNYYHKAGTDYYPPHGDTEQGWDCIDLFGWLGYPMQIKIDFQSRNSIMAAPSALDLVLFMDLAARVGMGGIQAWLSFYFNTPMHFENALPEHDFFRQFMELENVLRLIMGDERTTHPDSDLDSTGEK